VVGCTATLLSSIGKELEVVGGDGTRPAGQVTETCGVLAAPGERDTAPSEVWSKSGTAEIVLELVPKTAALAAGTRKTLDAYLDLSKTYRDLERWVPTGAFVRDASALP